MDVARVYVGSDHAGFGLRRAVVEHLRARGREVVDLGPDSEDACDYPEYAYAVANAVRSDAGSHGILACATGQGMAIAAGKVRGIRAVVPTTVEAARLTRFDNDANVLCLGSRLMADADALAIVDTWLATAFAGGRHARRIAKVAAIETASAVVFVTESERLRLERLGTLARLFGGNGSPSPAWIALPATMSSQTAAINELAKVARRRPYQNLIVLVDDASTSEVAFMARVCAGSGMRLHVVCAATTAPPALDVLCEQLQMLTTFVLVASLRGDGQAIAGHEAKLWAKVLDACGGDPELAAHHFATLAPADSALADIARTHHQRAPFVEPVVVDDGFGLLGCAGLLPAALLGHDIDQLLARAVAMAQACRSERMEDNPGASLGVLLGALAKHGRNKLTLLLSRSLAPLGDWLVHLFARAAAHGPHRIEVVAGEPLLPSYPPDRVFVHVQMETDPPAAPATAMEALHRAGQPYLQIAVRDRRELGAEIFRWQMAATIAAVVMGAHPLAARDAPTAASPA